MTRFAPPALRAADGLDRTSRDPCSGNYRRRERKCLTTVDGGVTVGSSWLAATRSPLHIARCGACSNRRSQATIRSPLFKLLPGYLFVRWHVRETDNRTGLHLGLRPDADPAVHHTSKSSTLPRRYACQKSMRREMRSARPFTVNNSGIDARNGQAYHGRKTTTTNGTRPTVPRSRAGEEHRTRRQRRRRFTPRVRSRPGAAGCSGMFRTGTEEATARNSMR